MTDSETLEIAEAIVRNSSQESFHGLQNSSSALTRISVMNDYGPMFKYSTIGNSSEKRRGDLRFLPLRISRKQSKS